MMNIENLKFPIGKYTPNKTPDAILLEEWITTISSFPENIANCTKNIGIEALNWKYRPEGWTVKQVIHHCADSHMNCLIRFKLALTENTPTIRPYYEDKWANLPDALTDSVEDSMMLLKGLHNKWGYLLKQLTKEQLAMEFIHPEHGLTFNLAETIGNYAWHCQHHLAHIKQGLESKGIYN